MITCNFLNYIGSQSQSERKRKRGDSIIRIDKLSQLATWWARRLVRVQMTKMQTVRLTITHTHTQILSIEVDVRLRYAAAASRPLELIKLCIRKSAPSIFEISTHQANELLASVFDYNISVLCARCFITELYNTINHLAVLHFCQYEMNW